MTCLVVLLAACFFASCATEETPITVMLQNKPDDDPKLNGCAKLIQRSPGSYVSGRLSGCQLQIRRRDTLVFSLKIEHNLMDRNLQSLRGDLLAYAANRIVNNKADDCLTATGNVLRINE
ncbi:hypothetical protein T265_15814, partial [Opisthorchis viverrini]